MPPCPLVSGSRRQELIEAMGSDPLCIDDLGDDPRNGEYYNFSVSHQVGAGGAKDALLRSQDLVREASGCSRHPEAGFGDLMLAQKTIQQVEVSADGWRRTFAEAARTAAVEIYRGPLEADEALWSHMRARNGAQGRASRSRRADHPRLVREANRTEPEAGRRHGRAVGGSRCSTAWATVGRKRGDLPENSRPANVVRFLPNFSSRAKASLATR